MKQIGIVGAGFMGSAIVDAIRRQEPEAPIGVVEKDADRRAAAVDRFGLTDYGVDAAALAGASEIVFLAVKPQDLSSFGPLRSPSDEEPTVVSVLAGTPMARIQEVTGITSVVRIMPNLAAAIGKAVIGVSWSDAVPVATRTRISALLAGMGTAIEVPERLMGAITGVSGSGIAFVMQFIHAMAMAGVEQGIPYHQSLTAARDVTESAALLLRSTNEHPQSTISKVCSPAGTTIAGIRALADHSFDRAVMAAVAAATRRSNELEQ